MGRILHGSFKTSFPEVQEADIRFRKPEEKSGIQCRLGSSEEKTRVKGADYPKVEMVQEMTGEKVRLVLKCPHIGEKGECNNRGWCSQLGYDDIVVSKKD